MIMNPNKINSLVSLLSSKIIPQNCSICSQISMSVICKNCENWICFLKLHTTFHKTHSYPIRYLIPSSAKKKFFKNFHLSLKKPQVLDWLVRNKGLGSFPRVSSACFWAVPKSNVSESLVWYLSELNSDSEIGCGLKWLYKKGPHKTLKKEDRLKSKMVLLNSKPIGLHILVDDLVTSGATAEAAYLALGKPRRFEVWCISSRYS